MFNGTLIPTLLLDKIIAGKLSKAQIPIVLYLCRSLIGLRDTTKYVPLTELQECVVVYDTDVKKTVEALVKKGILRYVETKSGTQISLDPSLFGISGEPIESTKLRVIHRVVSNPQEKEALTKVIEYYRVKVGTIDGPQRSHELYASHLLKKAIKMASGDYDKAVELIQAMIDAGLADRFHSKNITNFKYLYYNGIKIANSYIKGRPTIIKI